MAKLIADGSGKIKGRFTVPENIPAGAQTAKFTGQGGSAGEALFVGNGSLTTTVLRNVTTTYYSRYWVSVDPLAQTMALERDAWAAGVDLWFTDKKSEVRVQIRDVQSGVPGRDIMAEAIVPPEKINLSGPTRILFDMPVFLEANTEFALVILCDDPQTAVAVAKLGEFDKFRQEYVTQQPFSVGVMLSSSNASTWTPHQEYDLCFRLLEADFGKAAELVLDLGSVEVENATDLLLLSVADVPTAACQAEYELSLPDGSKMTVAPGQPVTLSSQVSGEIGLKVKLSGDAAASASLYPGTQLMAGQISSQGDYYSRSVVASNAVKATLVYNAKIPSGATVTAEIQEDGGEWKPFEAAGNTQGDDGWVEFRFQHELANLNLVKARLTLRGTTTARPQVADFRLLATA